MRLILRKVRLCNFMSFGNMVTEIDLCSHATTLIVGKNGSGKSSAILDSISFVLFNKPFRNIRKPQLTNSINNKSCIVELEFTANATEFMVRRGMKPALFEIFKNGELITQAADNRDYQAEFEKYIIKVNHKTFCQIVMLGSAIFTPFMALPALSRRDVIEDLLDLKIFSTMNSLLKDRLTTTTKDLSGIQTKKQIIDEKIAVTEHYIAESIAVNDTIISDKEEQITGIEWEMQVHSTVIEDLKGDLERYMTWVFDAEKGTTQFEQLTKLQYQMQSKIGTIKREIAFLEDNENCPTCKQVIEPEFKVEAVAGKTNHVTKLQEGMTQLSKKHAAMKVQVDHLDKAAKAMQLARIQIQHNQSAIDSLRRNIGHLEADIERLRQAKGGIDRTELDGLKANALMIHADIVELEDSRTVMGYATNMLKDAGIKSQIIKMYIPIINKLIEKYLAALDFFVLFELDENFNETIKSRHRDDFSYMSFSEGEKCRLNIAILFAWRAIAKMRGSIDCNLIVLDELFDSSLDTGGIDDMIKLLNNLTSGENCFIISHREDQISDKFSRVIRFTKIKNFSQIEG